MRRTWLLGAAVLALIVSSAGAHDFAELRKREPAIDAAIAQMPSSGITGTLNRISAHVAQGLSGKQAEERMVATLKTLESQLRAGLPSLSLSDRLVIAQVIQLVAIEDLLVLQGGGGGVVLVPCPIDMHEWGTECHPPIERALDDIAELLEASIREGYDREAAADPSTALPPPPPAPHGGIGAANFGEWLEEVVDQASLAVPVESIDD